jgi:hypothetical protein
MDNSRMKDWVNGQPLPTTEAQLQEARELLLHFQFIAHGPGCACVMCERRTAWLARTADKDAKSPAQTQVCGMQSPENWPTQADGEGKS